MAGLRRAARAPRARSRPRLAGGKPGHLLDRLARPALGAVL